MTNDLCFLEASSLNLDSWVEDDVEPTPTDEAIAKAIKSLKNTKVAKFISAINQELASFDWRTSSALGLDEDERLKKAALRGSGGYKELRRQLLKAIEAGGGVPARTAKKALSMLKYD